MPEDLGFVSFIVKISFNSFFVFSFPLCLLICLQFCLFFPRVTLGRYLCLITHLTSFAAYCACVILAQS